MGLDELLPLWEGLLERMGGDDELAPALDALRRDHLVTADLTTEGIERYACHPILRDHFRALIAGDGDRAQKAADLLSSKPDATEVQSLATIEPIVTAIELLLNAGEIVAADDLYRSRLGNGRVFVTLPAPQVGMELARGFVRDQTRRQAVASSLGQRRVSFYLNAVGLRAKIVGEPSTALAYYQDAAGVDRATENDSDLCVGLINQAQLEVQLGMLAESDVHIGESLALGHKVDSWQQIRNALTFQAHVASVRGEVRAADAGFTEANGIENNRDPDGADPFSLRGVHWAEYLLRTGADDDAERLTQANRSICERNRWRDDQARCDWILGWVAERSGDQDEAVSHRERARAVFDRGHMIHDLAGLLVTEATALVGMGRMDDAKAACGRALNLAAPRGYRLVQADALNVRAKIQLAQDDHSSARDDAEAALQLCESTGYAWGERDALRLLAQAYRALGDDDQRQAFQARANALDQRLSPQ